MFVSVCHALVTWQTMWLGGAAGDVIRPAVADLGVSEGAFFADLSTRTTDVDDYALASKIFANQEPYTMVIGWHRYDVSGWPPLLSTSVCSY